MSKHMMFSKLLKEKRILCGLSQNQVSKKCYLSKSYYNHFETGKRIPSLETLIRICSSLNTNPIEFLYLLIPDDIKEENPGFTGFLQQNKKLNTNLDIRLLESYKILSLEEQKAILDIIDSLMSNHSII